MTPDNIMKLEDIRQVRNWTQFSNEGDVSNYLDTNFEPSKLTNDVPNTNLSNVVDISDQMYVPLSTNLWLKQKHRMLYFPVDFGKLTVDGLVDTGVLSSAIPEVDLNRNRLLVKKAIIEEDTPPNFRSRNDYVQRRARRSKD